MIDRANPKVLFLYTELAEYVRRCFDALARSGVEVHVVSYPVNPEAPFEFDQADANVHYYARENFEKRDLEGFVRKLDPAAIFCSGWVDAAYVRACRSLKGSYKTVLISDNALTGGWRSRVSAFRARWLYKSAFDGAFVAGEPQHRYARKMGFRNREIRRGFYAIDSERFRGLAAANTDASKPFPKRFVFAGRYVDFKGVVELWRAFEALGTTEWELHCVGTGPLFDHRPSVPNLIHHGFVQPAEMDTFVAEGGVFVLPSHKEPWGVVVHEFAAAGYPLICSDRVGAASAFLVRGINGLQVRAGSADDLTRALKQITRTDDEDLREMARQSLSLAEEFSTKDWVETIYHWIS